MADLVFPSANDVADTAGQGKDLHELRLATKWMKSQVAENYVSSGLLLPATDADLTLAVPSGEASIEGYYVARDADSVLVTANQINHVFLKLTVDGLGLVSGAALEANTTGTPPARSVKLGTATAGAGSVTATDDLRPVKDNAESHFRSGLEVTRQSAVLLRVGGGTLNLARRGKVVTLTAPVDLDISSAGDFATGGGSPGANQWVYVVVDEGGTCKLTTLAPTISDYKNNAAGRLQYRKIGGTLWRYLAARRSNASTQLESHDVVGRTVWKSPNAAVLSAGTSTAFAAVSCAGEMPPIARVALLQADLVLDLNKPTPDLIGSAVLRKTGGSAEHSVLAYDLSSLADVFNKHKHSFDGAAAGDSITSTPKTGTTTGSAGGGVTTEMQSAELKPPPFRFPVDSSQQFDYRIANDALNLTVRVMGYEEDLD